MAEPVRRRLLRVLEDSPGPCDVETLASTVSLHPNTVRGHLDILQEAKLVVRSTRRRNTPGRPRIVYSRSSESDEATATGYRLLAEILAATVDAAAEDPAAAAERAGREWGSNLCRCDGGLAAGEALVRMTGLLDDIGFRPQTSPDGDRTIIELTDCPFRDLARDRPEIICALHLGLMRGAAEGLGGGMEVERLQPFVEPSLCRTVVYLT